jgi:hypothetical protein
VEFTERANAEFFDKRQSLWHDCIKREWANLHAALDFALTQPELGDSALALVGNLCWYFRGGTDYIQSAQWLERALQAGRLPMRRRARALIALGMVLHQAQAHDRAGARLREGIALATRLGEAWLAAAGQAILAFELATCRDFSAAETLGTRKETWPPKRNPLRYAPCSSTCPAASRSTRAGSPLCWWSPAWPATCG